MKNEKLAKIFKEISILLQIENEPFKAFAYKKASLALENLREDIEEIFKQKGKKGIIEIHDIGETMAEQVIEYLKEGKISYYEILKEKYPLEAEALLALEGIGPKRIRVLFEKLKIKNLKELEKAARENKIQKIPGFGRKIERNILREIQFFKKYKGKLTLFEALKIGKEIQIFLKNLKEIKEVKIAGELRRKKEIVKEIVFVVSTSKIKKIKEAILKYEKIEKVLAQDEEKILFRLESGALVSIYLTLPKSFGAHLLFYTGSQKHLSYLLKRALDMGCNLTKHGLFKKRKMIAGWREGGIYKALGLPYIPPEIREGEKEFELALSGRLSSLLDFSDIKGDLHCHSNWNGGKDSIEKMALEAMKRGYSYLGISDHSKFLKIERGLDEKRLSLQRKEIEKLNQKFKKEGKNFKILQGVEANILKDGKLDLEDKTLAKLDYVIAGIHSHFKLSKKEMTKRLEKAMKNPYVKIISHPTGRILKERDEYKINFDRILKVAKATNTALEINSWPSRLDLGAEKIELAKKMGVKLIIGSDAHSISHLGFIKLGVWQAKRGFLEKKDVLNCFSQKKILNFLKK